MVTHWIIETSALDGGSQNVLVRTNGGSSDFICLIYRTYKTLPPMLLHKHVDVTELGNDERCERRT